MRRGFVSAGGRGAPRAGGWSPRTAASMSLPGERTRPDAGKDTWLAGVRGDRRRGWGGRPDRWGADAGVGLNPGAWFGWGLMRPLPSTLFTRTPELEGG